MSWTWRLETADGSAIGAAANQAVPTHATQSDAETWLGENWRNLADEGIAQASLICDTKLIYGPMKLAE